MTVTPAWGAYADHDMYHSGLDYYPTFAMRLRERLRRPENDFAARQATAIWFTAAGLTARSVTAVRSAPMSASALLARRLYTETDADAPTEVETPTSVLIRHIHPFASVAYSVSEHPGSPWHTLPVWSAWVTDAIEA